MGWPGERNYGPNNNISDSTLRKKNILMAHNTAGGLWEIGLLMACIHKHIHAHKTEMVPTVNRGKVVRTHVFSFF